MPKRLTGSAGTGKKIMQNLTLFNYIYNGSEALSGDKTLYKFNWTFGNQAGHISINVHQDGRIDESSLINCAKNPREFMRPLGAYNDRSLYDVFRMMLDHQHISYK